MKIAIISDTHGNVPNFKKAVNWLNKENISMILHCGDIGNPESLKESLVDFEGDFLGVLGNMDVDYKKDISEYNFGKVKVEEEILKTEIGGNPPSPEATARRRKIAITHRPEQARILAESKDFDLVFYGHTHRPWEEKIGDCRLINPGELAGQINKPTFAVYDTETGELKLKILEKI